MTLDFFLKSYNFDDFEILNIELNNNSLRIEVEMLAHIDLIANGYRPELDVDMKKAFIFNDVNIKSLLFSRPYFIKILEYTNDVLILNVCDNKLIISGKRVDVVSL